MSVSIRVQETPNPNARKFTFSGLRFDRPQSYADREAAAANPIAAELFAVGGIYNVFMVEDFVTVNKLRDVSWDEIQPQIVRVLETYLSRQQEFQA